MTLEQLTGMGLTEEQAKGITAALDGAYVTKARFNVINTELKQSKEFLKERDQQLKELQKSDGDAKTLKEQMEALQMANKETVKKHESEMQKVRAYGAAEVELLENGAINTKAVMPFLEEHLKTAQMDGDRVKGLSGLIGGLKAEQKTMFLFHGEKEQAGDSRNKVAAGYQFRGVEPGESSADKNSASTDAFLEGFND